MEVRAAQAMGGEAGALRCRGRGWTVGKEPRGAGAHIKTPGGLELRKPREGRGRRLQVPPPGAVESSYDTAYIYWVAAKVLSPCEPEVAE